VGTSRPDTGDLPGGVELVAQDGVAEPDRLRRLWAPHRLAYVKGDPDTGRDDDGGCPFDRIPSLADRDGLVIARGRRCYAVLNLHPYNPGHLMVVPYRHLATLEELDDDELVELMTMTREAVRAVRAVSQPHGFNVGLNLGGVAGGSLSEHLHQHVVPRWGGDANFLTVLAGTKVIPQLLAETRELVAAAWTR
jgi:ATP adenylyltransferase